MGGRPGASPGPDAEPDVAELAGRLRIALSRLGQAMRTQDAGTGVTPTRIATLAILEDEGPLRVGALADRIGISAPTMSRLVDCLDELDFVGRSPDPDDHRATRISLRPGGADLLAHLRHRGTGLLAQRIGGLDGTGIATLAAAVPVLEAIAGVDPRVVAGGAIHITSNNGQH